MDIALSEHQRKLGSALRLSLFFELLQKISNYLCLLDGTVICHASHGNSDLLSTSKSLGALWVKLDQHEMVIYFEDFLEVVRLKLGRQFGTKQHSCLLSCVIH